MYYGEVNYTNVSLKMVKFNSFSGSAPLTSYNIMTHGKILGPS